MVHPTVVQSARGRADGRCQEIFLHQEKMRCKRTAGEVLRPGRPCSRQVLGEEIDSAAVLSKGSFMETKTKTDFGAHLLAIAAAAGLAACVHGKPTADTAADGQPKQGQADLDEAREALVARISGLGGKFETDTFAVERRIVKIDLHASAVSDDDMALLAGAPGLRHLDLRLTGIGDRGVRHLDALTELRFLNLFRTKVGDRGVAELHSLRNVDTLLLGGTQITDAGLASLKSFPNLRKLSIFDTQITDAAIPTLAALGSLEVLLVGKTKISDAGLKALQKALPKVRFDEPT